MLYGHKLDALYIVIDMVFSLLFFPNDEKCSEMAINHGLVIVVHVSISRFVRDLNSGTQSTTVNFKFRSLPSGYVLQDTCNIYYKLMTKNYLVLTVSHGFSILFLKSHNKQYYMHALGG